jgi:SAM-dependent methyltransferase
MDRARFSRIAHSFLPVAAPLDRGALHDVLKLLPLDTESSVLDVGCGRAALLIDLLIDRGVRGTGVDCDGDVLRIARATAEARGCADRLTLVETMALELVNDALFDLTLCVGASHALGGPVAALERLARWTRPGGYALWGEGFWRRDPDPAYLAAIGSSKHDLAAHHENAATAHERGWSVLWSAVTSDSCWDEYEGLYRMGMARYLAEHPEDPEASAFRERSERWYDSYLRWGRETMGFALYLLERDSSTGLSPAKRSL